MDSRASPAHLVDFVDICQVIDMCTDIHGHWTIWNQKRLHVTQNHARYYILKFKAIDTYRRNVHKWRMDTVINRWHTSFTSPRIDYKQYCMISQWHNLDIWSRYRIMYKVIYTNTWYIFVRLVYKNIWWMSRLFEGVATAFRAVKWRETNFNPFSLSAAKSGVRHL